MKKWNIPVTWEMAGVVCIEADTLDEAIHRANNDDSIGLPSGYYVESSFVVSYDDPESIRQLYNHNQADDKKVSTDSKENSLAARLVSFYKDFDFYDFMDNMELGQTEEDVIMEFEKQLDSPKSTAGILETLKLIHREDLPPEQSAEVVRLIHDLGMLHTKTPPKVSLKDQIASADSRRTESHQVSPEKERDSEPQI